MAAALLTSALRRRFAELGSQDYGDEAKEIVVGHFFLPGTGWDWWTISYDEDGGVPQLFCLVRGQEIELGYVALAELRQRLSTPPRRSRPSGYWRRGEDWWTERKAEDGVVPGDAEYVIWPERRAEQ